MRLMRGWLGSAILTAACLAAIAGCGSSHSAKSPSSATASRPASSATSTSPSTPSSSTAAPSPSTSTSGSSGETSKSPDQILADAAGALRNARSYAMRGTLVEGHQHIRLSLATTSATSVALSFAIGRSAADLIGLPGASYIRGNASFWGSQSGAPAVRLAGHWIQVPSSSGHTLTSSLGEFAPASLARCLAENHGTLSIAGRSSVGGQAAILLKDAGDKPGSTRSVLAVAATGTPYPLRYTASGERRAGGRIDVCNKGKANHNHGTLAFGEFGKVPPIQAPPNPISPSGSAT